MRAITNCDSCRKKILQAAKDGYLKEQYAIYRALSRTFACYCTATVLMVFIRRGRTKKYIQEIFEDMVAIFDMPNLFGKDIILTDVMTQLEKEYGIDFKRIKVHIETEKQFLTGMRKDDRL